MPTETETQNTTQPQGSENQQPNTEVLMDTNDILNYKEKKSCSEERTTKRSKCSSLCSPW